MEGAAKPPFNKCGLHAVCARCCSSPHPEDFGPAPPTGANTEVSSRIDINVLVGAQNRDGGWPYRKGAGSWTEPTVYALLAQLADWKEPESFGRGVNWLRTAQRADGGWSPNPTVAQSTWVTALVALLPSDSVGLTRQQGAVEWLLRQKGEESSFLYRLRNKLLGRGVAGVDEIRDGWPFFPGAAAWVTPTALTILALEKMQRLEPGKQIDSRIDLGRQFLLDRICRDGGWNYGRSNVLGVEADSYPETTGVALLALHGARSPRLPQAIHAAQEHLQRCRSAEAMSWLMLGLAAHGQKPSRGSLQPPPCRTVQDQALSILADAACKGRNLFLG